MDSNIVQNQAVDDARYRRQLEAICNNATVALFIMDEQYHCTYLNPAAVALSGYTLDEMRGKPLHDVIHHSHPDGSAYPMADCPIASALMQSSHARGEEVFVHKDGHFYDVAFAASLIHEGERVVGAVLEVQDITERKRAEARFHALLAAARVVAWDYNLATDHVGYSGNAQQVLGLLPDAPLSRAADWHACMTPESRVAHEERMLRALQEGRDYTSQFKWIRPDNGACIDIESRGTVIRNQAGEPQSVIGVIMDVTDRRQAEAELRESAARLQFTLESAEVGDWDLDLTTDTSRRSLRHDRCFGYTEPIPEWGFETFIRHVHPDDRARVEQAFRSAVSELKDWHFECRVIWPDHSVHWIAAHGSIYYVDGKPSRMLGIIFDITERKRVEEALKAANAQLIESDRRKDEFLAMLAHELRNPLGAVSNTVNLLARSEAAAGLRRYVDILQRQTRNLRGLVDDLLDVSRVTRGLITLKHERIELAGAIERALESVRELLDEKQHDVSVTLPRKPLVIVGDPVRLEQILVNLLTNAAKYTDHGGRISISLERAGDHATLRVRDTGIGMTPQIIERIFDLFGQAERGLDRSQGGLGIGLTIVKNLVELHGGRIEAHSEGEGKGAEFVVTLPLAADEIAAAPAPAPGNAVAVAGKRVLVVDDSVDIAETLALLLEESGHTVVVAHDGPTALAKADEFQPELILLDIGLPGMNGYEVARQLRQNPRTRNTVLAALTGYGQAGDREQALAAGFDRHFVKPVDIDELQAFVDEAQSGRG
jgi:PAS domain S-box-containing protein